MNKIFNFLFFTDFYFGSIFASNIEFEADKTSFDAENELLLLEGNVSLKIENLLFKADQVSLDNKNKVFSSEKISFSSLDDFLYGQTNFVSISENETIMRDVEFSTCPCEDKIWWVESEELKFLNSNNTLAAKKSKLKVQGRTLAYLNNANFPISAKRKSGILLPEISINERSGLDVKIPVYLNLKENLDLTVEPRLMTQRGYGLTNQLRYLGQGYEGYFNSSFLKDDESSFNILERDDFSQNLIENTKTLDIEAEHVIKKFNESNDKKSNFWRFVLLKSLNELIYNFVTKKENQYNFSENSQETKDKVLKQFERIFFNAKQYLSSHNTNLIFVYSPTPHRYREKNFQDNYQLKNDVLKIIENLEIKIIDLDSELFSNIDDIFSLYPFRMDLHPNQKGYEIIAKFLYSKYLDIKN